VSPELARVNEPITLAWTTTRADTCRTSWDGGVGARPAQGSDTRTAPNTPTGQSIYEVECDGRGGSVKGFVTLRIHTFSGKAGVPLGVFADADVNDPDAPYFSNDTTGQPIGSFGLSPGYMNVAGSGPPGRSLQSGDVWDFYRTDQMQPGQIIRLILPTVDISKPLAERDDADLYLYDISGNLLDASLGNGPEETLEITTKQNYVIGIKAEHGGFNYLLSLEDPPATLSLGSQRLSTNFVPGEGIVTQQHAAAAKGAAGIQQKSGPDREVLISVPTELPVVSGSGQQKIQQRRFGHDAERKLAPELQRKLATLQQLKQVARTTGARSVTVNRILEAQAVPSDPLYARQRWHYEAAELPAAWEITTGSPNVTVAVVDSGAARNHPDLEAKFVDGYDMVGHDVNFEDPGGESSFHGTHVLGTVGAIANNGEGGSGIAWGSKLMPVRALNGRSGTLYDILQAVRYAAGFPNDSGVVPAHRADIINLSLGSQDACTPEEADLFSAVVAAGVTVVAAAGNSSSNVEFSPASCPGVFGVIATGPGNLLARYSNFGAPYDLAAPGGDMRFDADADGFLDGVFSTVGPGTPPGYAAFEGTSMATPHVAGIFALMKSVRPTLTPTEIQQLLEGGFLTDDLGDPGRDELGFGMINAFKAVQAASGVFTVPARVGVAPGLINFGNQSGEVIFEIRNAGSGLLTITNVQPTVSWLRIVPGAINTSGLGFYRAIASNDGLPRGTHNGTIEIQSSAGLRTVPVTISKLNFNVGSYLGAVHVQVKDAASGALIRTQAFTGFDPSFLFQDLPLGTYTLTAGTDFNNDGNLCDPGEICGFYPISSFAEPIVYNGVALALDVPMVVTAWRR
jgi:serine protease